jgi:ferredoxin--NADP+ reductase
VTREEYEFQGRITGLIESGKFSQDIGLPALNPETDRAMLCGSPAMLKDTCKILDQLGFVETRHGELGSYVVERAFVES